MPRLHVLRVFTDASSRYGNGLGVFLDGVQVPDGDRQEIAGRIGLSEVVFVDDVTSGVVRIFSPKSELPFAGHPLVGTGWLLSQEGVPVSALRPPAGDVPAWMEGENSWIRAKPEWSPQWEQIQLASAERVQELKSPEPEHDFTQFWAWKDETDGAVRARVFASRIGTYEDEACGSASLLLADRLGRPIVIDHGEGSVVYARPGPNGSIEVGGRVSLDDIRDVG